MVIVCTSPLLKTSKAIPPAVIGDEKGIAGAVGFMGSGGEQPAQAIPAIKNTPLLALTYRSPFFKPLLELKPRPVIAFVPVGMLATSVAAFAPLFGSKRNTLAPKESVKYSRPSGPKATSPKLLEESVSKTVICPCVMPVAVSMHRIWA